MQGNRTAGDPWHVRGLGVCDALELRVDAAHLPWLLDELDAMRERRATPDELAAYERRLLARMRAAAARGDVAGPSGLIQEAVRGTAARAPAGPASAAWAALALECRRVLAFNVDPAADPAEAL